MQNSPLVSVLMPAYNAEKFIAKAIESILSQTFKNFEFIIINDSSKDSTQQIIEYWAKKDCRIAIINNKNNFGVTTSLNRGLERVKGKYVARMDADDISHPKRLLRQVEFMESNPETVVCGCCIEFIDENGKHTGFREYLETDSEIKKKMNIANPFAHPSVMINHLKVKELGLKYSQEFPRCEDYHLWFQIKEFGTFHNLKDRLLLYRLTKTALKNTKCKEMIKDTIKLKWHYASPKTVEFYTRVAFECLTLLLPTPAILLLFRKINKIDSYD